MNKGSFKKNDKRINRAGRPKGSGTRSDEVRTWVTHIVENNWHKLEAALDEMTNKEAALFMGQYLLKQVLPPPIHDLEKLTDAQLQQLLSDLQTKRKLIIN